MLEKNKLILHNISIIIEKYEKYIVDLSDINHVVKYKETCNGMFTGKLIFGVSEDNADELLLNDKYFVEGYKKLSIQVSKILRTYDEYNTKYSKEFGVNRNIVGFNTPEELFHFACWLIENANIEINKIEKKIKELEPYESTLSYSELLERQKRKEYLIVGIYDNLFNIEVKEKYEKEYIELVTIHSLIERLKELYKRFKPLETVLLEIK